MKTKFRTTTIFFALGLLGVCGAVPILTLPKDIYTIGQLPTGVIVFLVFFTSLFICGVIGLIWFTLQVDIDLITDSERKREIEISKMFDYEQAKDIRFHLGILTLFLTAIISILVHQMLTGQVTKPKTMTIAIGAMLVIEFLTIKRFIKIHESQKRCITRCLTTIAPTSSSSS